MSRERIRSYAGKTESGPVTIRPYHADDAPALRSICFATGCIGRPADLWLDLNAPFFTDLWLDYYLSREPQHARVAVINGKIIGYLTGCVDTRQRVRYMWTVFWPRAIWRLLTGRYRFGRRTLKVLIRGLHDALRYGFPRVPKGYPAHFHYNVDAQYRGNHARCGICLFESIFTLFRDRGIPGCHGIIIVPRAQSANRYRHLARIADARPTSLYRDADPRELCLASVVAETGHGANPRYWKRFFAKPENKTGTESA